MSVISNIRSFFHPREETQEASGGREATSLLVSGRTFMIKGDPEKIARESFSSKEYEATKSAYDNLISGNPNSRQV